MSDHAPRGMTVTGSREGSRQNPAYRPLPVLTPLPHPPLRVNTRAGLAGLLLALGCQRAPAPAVVAPAPVPVIPSPEPAPVPPFATPAPSTASLLLDVRTRIVSSDPTRRDSTNTEAEVSLRHDPRGLLVHVARNDSAGRLDSLPPITVDAAGRWTAGTIPLPCKDLGLLPSPLVARLFQPRSAHGWPVSDTLRYTLCARGAPRRVDVVISWAVPRPAADGAWYEHDVQLSGLMSGDSTRAFPMRLTGTLRGQGTLRVSAEGRLLGSAGTLTVELAASANTLRQAVTQSVSFTALPRP